MKLLPEITVVVSPEQFQFSCEEQQLTLHTCVHLVYDEKGRHQFVSMGEKVDIPDAIFVPLFENQPLDPAIERFELITAFMEYGIGRLYEKFRHPVLKPKLIIRGAESFRTYFSGYHRFFLEAVALASGAREVRFE